CVTEYTYCLSINGSVGILSNLSTFVTVASQKLPCVQASVHEYSTGVPSVVIGYFPAHR
ncbi:hypothetical protein HOB94_06915, partial [bacterium]|nr:hypothetical protein [bacterium]